MFSTHFGSGCPKDMIFFENSCFVVVKDRQTFAAAQEHCHRVFGGAYLPQIKSTAENFAVARLSLFTNLWIGYKKVDKSLPGREGWQWTETKVRYPNGYNDWTAGEPNGKGGSGDNSCANIWGDKQVTTWDDRGCDSKLYPVCERGELSSFRERNRFFFVRLVSFDYPDCRTR